jgi:hypothetical protein
MTILRSVRWRIFLVAWILYSAHFATNVVREHYPAFSIVDHGTFRVDEYQGFHSDIFVHHDGHSVVGNQVLVSVLAAVPLFVFDPVLDALEAYSQARLDAGEPVTGEYRIDKPMRQEFFRLVRERGLELRFGAATVVTSVFFMAPLTALFLVFFHDLLRRRGLSSPLSVELTFLLGFGTPLFFRASTLNHNMFVMFAMFVSFALLWRSVDSRGSSATFRLLLAGLFAGLTLATDYVGVLLMPLLWAYCVVSRRRLSTWGTAIWESRFMVVGSLPPIGFLLYSQWAMYGNPFLPGQYWMPNQNEYVNLGARGFTLPDMELLVMCLFDPAFGLYAWAPVLALALLPVSSARRDLIAPGLERRWIAVVFVTILLFTSANQYTRLQWNSGLRYLLPVVPFCVLVLADRWSGFGRGLRWTLIGASVSLSWMLTVYRESVPQSWRLLVAEGPQLPWYRVLSMTGNPESPWLHTTWIPSLLLAGTLATTVALWRYGARLETRQGPR